MYSTTGEFLSALKSSNMRVATSVTTSTGLELAVGSGSVSMDSNRDIGRTCSLELMPTESMTVDDIYSLVRSPGMELTVKRGLAWDVPEYATTVSTNLVTNPSMETGTTTTLRTNLIANPNFEVNSTTWFVDLGTISRDTVTFYSGIASLKFVGTSSNSYITNGASGRTTISASTAYTVSAYVKGDTGRTFTIGLSMFNSGGTFLGNQGSTAITATGNWQRVSVTVTSPATAASAVFYLINGFNGTHTIYVDAVMFEQSATLGDYFDGSTSAAGDFTYAWSGTAHASTSIQTGVVVTSQTGSASRAIQSTAWAASGTKSLRIVPTGTNASYASSTYTGLTIGQVYTVLGTVRLSAALTGTLNASALKITTNSPAVSLSSTASNAIGAYEVRGTFTATATSHTINLWNGASAGNGDVWWDQFAIIAGNYIGPYFDGSNGSTTVDVYAWTGTANASTSTRSNTAPTGGFTEVTELVPLGVFSTDEAEQSKSKTATVKWSGSDRSKKITRNRFLDPYQITAGTSLATAGALLLQSRLSGLSCDFSNVTETLAATIVFDAGAESNPWKSARQLFADYGYDLRFDGLGTARAVAIPDPATQSAVFDYGSADTSMVLDGTAKASLEGVYNGVIVSGEGTDVAVPVRAEVWDTDPSSPTYYLSGFGKVPYFFSSSLLTTADQCSRAATSLLARVKGRFQQLSWPSLVNPALEPLDIVTVTFWDKTSTCVIDSLTIPLGAGEAMSAAARETSIT